MQNRIIIIHFYILFKYLRPWFDNYGFESSHNMKECKYQVGDAFLNVNKIIPNENKDKYFKVKEVEVYKIIFKFKQNKKYI